MSSELTRRVLFAVVAAPLAIVIIYAGGAPLATLAAVIAALGAWEFCRIARAAGADPFDGAAIAAAACVPLLAHGLHEHVLSDVLASPTAVALLVLAVFAATIFLRGTMRRPLLAAATTVFGVAYVTMITYVYTIRHHDYVVTAAGGTALVMLPVLLTWATDVGGYAFGRMLGKRKLIPSVSPGKTVAGAVGGTILAVVVCALYVRLVLRPVAQLTFTPFGVLTFGIVVAAVAQIGDLAESLLKREAGVKDSSSIIPGHGGILDRFDSMLFALPVASLLLHVLLVAVPA